MLININNSNALILNTAVVTIYPLNVSFISAKYESGNFSFNNRQMVSWFLISNYYILGAFLKGSSIEWLILLLAAGGMMVVGYYYHFIQYIFRSH